MKKYSQEIISIFSSYTRIHESLREIETKVQELMQQRSALGQELDDTRKAEKALINKIEKEMDRAITQNDLLEILQGNE